MGLFTDYTITTIADLVEHESAILDVASAENINLASKLKLAQEEIGVELESYLAGMSPSDRSLNGSLALRNFAVTGPLRLWHVFHTLELAYRDAYFNQLNDRYDGKQKEYRRLAKWAAEKLLQTGFGIVWDPMSQASAPALDNVVAGNLPETTYCVSTSWLNAGGEEGTPGIVLSITTPAGTLLRVRPTNRPTRAAKWNVYAGMNVDSMSRQNTEPMDPNQPWVIPGTGLVQGPPPGRGQGPNGYRPVTRLIQRG